MGYLTEVILHVDALHAFREDPKLFGEAIIKAVDEADKCGKQVSVPFNSFCNFISAEPCRHADHHALFLSRGNHVAVIGQYEKDWETLVMENPDLAKEQIKEAKTILKRAEAFLKIKKEDK